MRYVLHYYIVDESDPLSATPKYVQNSGSVFPRKAYEKYCRKGIKNIFNLYIAERHSNSIFNMEFMNKVVSDTHKVFFMLTGLNDKEVYSFFDMTPFLKKEFLSYVLTKKIPARFSPTYRYSTVEKISFAQFYSDVADKAKNIEANPLFITTFNTYEKFIKGSNFILDSFPEVFV